MQKCDLPQTADKSTKLTPRIACSPNPFPEQSSILSLNLQDLKTLMRKKQRQYQNELQIQDAQRVHNFIAEIQQVKKEASQLSNRNCKITLKKEVVEYSRQTIVQFQENWKKIRKENAQRYQQINKMFIEQHSAELQNAIDRIQQIKNGKIMDQYRKSSKILQLEDQLKKLVKTQRYQQAYLISSKLEKAKTQETQNFIKQSVKNQQLQLQKLKKKQAKQRLESQKRRQLLQAEENSRYLNQLNQLTKNLKTYQIDLNKIHNSVKRQDRQRHLRDSITRKKKKNYSLKNNQKILKHQIITIINNEPDIKQQAK